eukprot:UN27854
MKMVNQMFMNSPLHPELVFDYMESLGLLLPYTVEYVKDHHVNSFGKISTVVKEYSIPEICASCGGSGVKKVCGKCFSVCYCNPYRQKRHWKTHKKV